jgi:hypothetical protein
MDGFERTDDGFVGRFDRGEPALLTAIVAQYLELLHDPALGATPEDDVDVIAQLERELGGATTADLSDPVLRRLFPAAYPDTAAAEDDYRRFTRAELRDARLAAAVLMRDDLMAAGRDGRVPVPTAHTQAWLTTLTALRLTLSERHGINSQDDDGIGEIDHDSPDAPSIMLYHWLSWVQETLLEILMR